MLLLAEVYRRGDRWKLRALGQGYADGLAGLARDFGVDVTDDPTAAGQDAHPLAGPDTHALTGTPTAAGRDARTLAGPDAYALTGTPPAVGAGADGFLDAVNAARASAGSPAVSPDARLAAAARAHAGAMAAAGAPTVQTRDGVSVYQRVLDAGYRFLTIGEHLVCGPRTPEEFVAYCLSTDRTRRTLHGPVFTHAGLARVTDGPSGGVYWTALWAAPLTRTDWRASPRRWWS